METVRVNMTPNNEVKTIHCSQNDGNTRKWGFELYKEDGVIDGSSIKEQMLFNAYKGGTEQILPENTSVPTTSPIIADIQYKDALRSEQEFLYRESPATVDGKAKITKIKGNTVKFNQLVQNGNFADNSNWTKGSSSATLVIANNKATITAVSGGYNNDLRQNIDLTVGHKYFIRFNYLMSSEYSGKSLQFNEVGTNIYFATFPYSSTLTQAKAIFTVTESPNAQPKRLLVTGNTTAGSVFEVSNFIIIDLTSMGIDNLTTTAQVEEWLSSHIGNLPYYDYTTGKLLPFLGEELKTTNADETETNVLSLPTLTYFPTGMKSAGSVYDELTESKAITRVGRVDMGTLDWGTYNADLKIWICSIPDRKYSDVRTNFASPKYIPAQKSISSLSDLEMAGANNNTNFYVRDTSSNNYSDFKTGVSGLYLYYELATPTETDITTASLVTEKGEAPLYYSSGLKADCSETISSEAGIFDAKIKVVDSETVYSQKLQLHVERKP